jgi:hypothetical protein
LYANFDFAGSNKLNRTNEKKMANSLQDSWKGYIFAPPFKVRAFFCTN